jgi:hypothetical protein
MNRETLRELEKSENLRVGAVAALAINADITFADAEKKFNAMLSEREHPTGLQSQYEIDAMFNC